MKNTGLTFTIEGVNIILSRREESIYAIQQQVKTVSGKIVDQNGEPIIGANVVEKGTTNGTVTDMEGKFSIDIASGSTLMISYIGYVEQIIPVTGKERLDIVLKEDSQSLDEVVVVGYGVQKKKLVTGATVQVKGDDLQLIRITD